MGRLAGGGTTLTLRRAGLGLAWLLAAGLPGVAAGAVPGLLGPAGVTHVGPLPPGDPRPLGTVVVDPFAGDLHVELDGVAGRFAWTLDGGWTLDGQPVTGADTREIRGPDGLPQVVDRRRWDWRDETVRAVLLPDGGRVGISTDDRGRLVGLTWPGGAGLQVSWDRFDRVVATEGPGAAVRRYEWRDGTLEVSDAQARPLRISQRALPDGGVAVTVADGAGREVRSRWTADRTTLLGWTDPRGQEAVVERSDGRLALALPGGARWDMELDPTGRLLGLRDPLGGTWWWRRDAAGRVAELEEPGGRVWRWDRDEAGRLLALGFGGSPWRLRRDEAGRVGAVVDPAGNAVVLDRDEAGRIVGITDPAGAVLRIRRHASGAVAAVQERTGATWELPAAISGGTARVQDPRGRSFELRRDAAGRLTALYDPDLGEWRLERAPDGAVTAVQAPDGQRWVLRQGPGGRLGGLVVPDVGVLGLQRDPAGDVTELRWEEGEEVTTVTVRRDVLGRPVAVEERSGRASAGEGGALRRVAWARDLGGRVRALQAPGRRLTLTRDPAGMIRAVRAGTVEAPWLLEVVRDAAGRITRWRGTDGEVTAQRDASGRVLREEVRLAVELAEAPLQDRGAADDTGAAAEELSAGDTGAAAPAGEALAGEGSAVLDPLGTLLVSARALAAGALDAATRVDVAWDPRGSVQGLAVSGDGASADAGWRAMRDAAGRLLRLVGPQGVAVGVDRDAAGRVQLVRHPAGSLQRRGVDGRELLVEVVGRDGRRLDGAARQHDARGRVVAEQALDGSVLLRPRDALGRGPSAVGRAAGEGSALAWGVGREALRRDRDEEGRLRWVVGEAGAVGLSWDALGRLEGLALEQGPRFTLRRDARGRLAAVLRDGLLVERLTWGPSLAAGASPTSPATLLRSGPLGARSWWSWGGGVAGLLRDGVIYDVITDPEGGPWWVVSPPTRGAAGDPGATRRRGDDGVGASDAAGLVGFGGAVQPFAGGPLLPPVALEGGAVPGARALDPVTREAVDGLAPWPWAANRWEPDGTGELLVASDLLDPGPWQSEAPWASPLDLLVELGQLQAPVERTSLSLAPPTGVLAGLPASLDTADPPLGPGRDSLPRDEILGPAEVDPELVAVVLSSALPGGRPLGPAAVLEVILAEEAGLPWLPPGLSTPWEGFDAP